MAKISLALSSALISVELPMSPIEGWWDASCRIDAPGCQTTFRIMLESSSIYPGCQAIEALLRGERDEAVVENVEPTFKMIVRHLEVLTVDMAVASAPERPVSARVCGTCEKEVLRDFVRSLAHELGGGM